MNKHKKKYSILRGIIFGLIIILGLGITITNIINRIMSLDYEFINSISSPDNSKTVYVYSVNVGATSDFSYRVTISSKKDFQDINKEKYFFNFDSNHGNASTIINVVWIDNYNLQIEYSNRIRSFTKKPNYNDIKIKYIEKKEKK